MESQIKAQLEQLRQETEKIDGKLDDLAESVKKIQHYLYDDTHTDSRGLVSEVRDLTKRVLKLEQKNLMDKAKASAWGAVGAFAIGLVYWLIKIVFLVAR